MPFPDALRLALAGAAITRSSWTDGGRIQLLDGELVELARDPNLDVTQVLLDAEDLQAADWELVR